MQKNKLIIALLFIVLSQSLLAQKLTVDRNMAKAYTKNTRSTSGLPGKLYWQNKANYTIAVKFDPESLHLTGTVKIDYTNNSPDTLKRLVFKLYPNLYKSNSMRNTALSADDLTDGMLINSFKIDGNYLESDKRNIRGTNMFVKGIQVLPHQKVSIDLEYSYVLNKKSFVRTGQINPGSFFIAYFFPRLGVYDDVDGWNEYEYLGKEEFYNDYGSFEAAITVPGNYRVWATGDLKNTDEVYEPEIASRITKAENSDEITDIITQQDLQTNTITKKNVTNTWKFEAHDVTDFAFAVSNNYVWKATSIIVDPKNKRRTRVDAVFNPEHKSYFPVVGYARKTVDLISYQMPAVSFPYSHITIVDGLDAMEYPMMVNNLPFENETEMIEFTAHEVFHTIFPFYVGTNETKYSFMDEGWATMTEFVFHPLIAPEVKLQYDLSSVNDFSGLAEDVPVMTPTAQLYGKARYADKDLKPALALYYLKEMLGEKNFVTAMQYYIHTWAGKHPTPYDFFNCMNTGAKADLNWYWKKWWFEKAVPNLAIAQVLQKGTNYKITIENKGGAPLPIHLDMFLKDGKKESISKDVAVWKDEKEQININFVSNIPIEKIILGNPYDADINPSDNIWVIKNEKVSSFF